jgi:hypothetical protein
LMGVKPAQSQIKNRPKFLAAAKFLAENPGASTSRIKRAVKSDQR